VYHDLKIYLPHQYLPANISQVPAPSLKIYRQKNIVEAARSSFLEVSLFYNCEELKIGN